MNGPVIEGKKCLLRPHRPEDAAEFIRMLADPKVNHYLARQNPPSLAGELEWIEAAAKNPNSLGWTIEIEGQCVGNVGLDGIDWHNGTGTAGIFIGEPNLWGARIASEIAQLLAEHIFTTLPLRKVKSSYLAPNMASGAVQASIGLREVGRWHEEYFRDGQWVDLVLTEVTRAEWEALRAELLLEG